MKNLQSFILVTLSAGLLFFCVSCEKMTDTYTEYLMGGEIVYPGKADSLRAFSGNERIALQWFIVSDPKVVGAVVYWNNGSDSVTVPIKKTRSLDTIRVILPEIDEGVYTFDVYTYDASGHRSIRSQVIGEVYGVSYQRALSNRLIRSMDWLNTPQAGEIPAFRGGQINWYGINSQAIFIDISYIQEDGTEVVLREKPLKAPGRQPLFREITRLPLWRQNSPITYRTAFMPDTLAIDTFYTSTNIYPR